MPATYSHLRGKEHTVTQAQARPHVGPVQVGIILLALATAFIHLYFVFFDEQITQKFIVLFILNFLGYVTLLSALYAPLSVLARPRPLVRLLLIAQAIASIAAYYYVGVFSTLGSITKGIEALLILLLLVEAASHRFIEG